MNNSTSSSSLETTIGKFGEWDLISLIEDEKQYKLYSARNINNQQKTLLKIYRDFNKVSEATLLATIAHPRLLAMDQTFTRVDVNSPTAIVFEDAPRGNLLDLIEVFSRFPTFIARSYFHQLIEALEYLHSANICHLNLNPESVFLDEHYCIKLAGFDRATLLVNSSNADLSKLQEMGDPSFYAPEMHENTIFDGYRSDVFSLGVVLFVMISGHLPFACATKDDELYQLIANENYEEFWACHEEMMRTEQPNPKAFFDEDFKFLMNRMLFVNQNERPTLKEIRESAWYNQPALSDEKLGDFVSQVAKKMRLF